MAQRARQTWDLASAELPSQPERQESAALYTFDGREVLAVVRAFPVGVRTAAMVGHNPAFEEVIKLLTGHRVEMKTSAIAVVRLASWAAAGDGIGELVTNGRPPSQAT